MTMFTRGVCLCAVLMGVSCGGGTTTPPPTSPPPTEGGKAISSISVEPSKATVSKGSTVPFHATAHFADGSTADVTADVIWNTSDPSVATVSKGGQATAIKAGLADITADYKGVRGHERFVVTP